jgi:hypothetical protein
MNLPVFEIGVTISAIAAGVALVAWFTRHAASASEKRMMHMLTCSGVEPSFGGHDDAWAIMQVARGRCSTCRSEDLCERWLAGKVEGDNNFCANVQMFRILKRITRRVAASTTRPDRQFPGATLPPAGRHVLRPGVSRDASRLLSPSIHSPIAAVL